MREAPVTLGSPAVGMVRLEDGGAWLAPRRAVLERLLPPLLVLSVVSAAMGSSIDPGANMVGHPLRWAGLAILVLVSGWVVWRRRPSLRLVRAEALLVAFPVLGLVSAAWSPWPRSSFAHACAFTLVVLGALFVGRVYRHSLEPLAPIEALALAGGVVAVSGLVLAFIHPAEAFQLTRPLRYRGFGENPDTVPLLLALQMPLLLCVFVAGRRVIRRRLALVGLVLGAETIFLAGSRGAILAALAGVLVPLIFAPRSRRWRLKGTLLVFAVLLYGLFSGSLVAAFVTIRPATVTLTHARAPGANVSDAGAACSKGAPRLGRRSPARVEGPPIISVSAPRIAGVAALLLPRVDSLFDGSGRIEAWSAAIRLGERKPVEGYGFGTEAKTFCNVAHELISVFSGGHVENSYIGLFLQLGLLGLLLFGALVVSALRAGVVVASRGGPQERLWVLTFLGVIVAALVQAVFQSYFYSAGNIATLTLFVCIALLLNRCVDERTTGRPGVGLLRRDKGNRG